MKINWVCLCWVWCTHRTKTKRERARRSQLEERGTENGRRERTSSVQIKGRMKHLTSRPTTIMSWSVGFRSFWLHLLSWCDHLSLCSHISIYTHSEPEIKQFTFFRLLFFFYSTPLRFFSLALQMIHWNSSIVCLHTFFFTFENMPKTENSQFMEFIVRITTFHIRSFDFQSVHLKFSFLIKNIIWFFTLNMKRSFMRKNVQKSK